ncbi:fungal transcriptional regulatory protein [Boeremia exigua]|uniref:fungal transcriptional regulatory protein n=1 Tax=Boeremia exigua TaxID=749465 RepID=UPI001E8EBB27|nr:fungal transcriptional regulatory protein [Boeremia exigua]KAH6616250.1 fungal transcriptional regulatory protein [Boeremia exigua]
MEGPNEPRAPKACINCRKQKMKCKMDHGDTCRRCRRAGLPCIFVPRANAAGPWKTNSNTDAFLMYDTLPGDLGLHLLQRVKAIEDHLGISDNLGSAHEAEGVLEQGDSASGEDGATFKPLWQAAATLEKGSIGPHNPQLWERPMLKSLFLTFHQKMPGLHFLPDKQKYSAPCPLLLAAILYCSSVRGTREEAELAPHYFTVLCSAISQLTIPQSSIGTVPEDPSQVEEWAFQTVLGLILGGLLAEASIRETGVWISIAYRFVLEYFPPFRNDRRHDWRKLFNGVQIADLEHASLHLSSPVIPIEPPVPSLQTSYQDQLYRLSRMMHTGLSHFAGRGLPTIWSCITGEIAATRDVTCMETIVPFTAVDAAVLRDWARQLDIWLEDFTRTTEETSENRRTVYRQYVLHRLTVLSIYHPARGGNLSKEQHELLLSARVTMKLHIEDKTIWSNWDIIMITWATLIVIQGIQGGVGESDDLDLIRAHLASLRETNETSHSLRHRLAERLSCALDGMEPPSSSTIQPNSLDIDTINPQFDDSWQIFDQASLDQVMLSAWSTPAGLQTSVLNPSNSSTYSGNPGAPMHNSW